MAKFLILRFRFLHCEFWQPPPLPLPPTCDVHACPRGGPRHVHCKLGEGGEGGVKLWVQNYVCLVTLLNKLFNCLFKASLKSVISKPQKFNNQASKV